MIDGLYNGDWRTTSSPRCTQIGKDLIFAEFNNADDKHNQVKMIRFGTAFSETNKPNSDNYMRMGDKLILATPDRFKIYHESQLRELYPEEFI